MSDRPLRDRAVDVALPEQTEVLKAVVVHDLRGERVEPPERGQEEDGERAEVGEQEPRERRRQQQAEAQPRVPVQEGGEAPPRTFPGRRLVTSGVELTP